MERWLRRRLPFPVPRTGRQAKRATRSVLVTGRWYPNPTFDYYLKGRLRQLGLPVTYVDVRDRSGLDAFHPDDSFVIVCRYAHRRLADWLTAHESRITGTGLLIDDDVHALISARRIPLIYKGFLLRDALMPWQGLHRRFDRIWASTPTLADRLDCGAEIMEPAPCLEDYALPREKPSTERLTMVFHAGGVHLEEHLFLRPVVEAALRRHPRLVFETYAEEAHARVWAGLDRVTVHRPLSWPEFKLATQFAGADIALVPLMPTALNQTRAPTKKIDVARLGAAGLFGIGAPYQSKTGERLVEYRPDAWAAAIDELVTDTALRDRLRLASRRAADLMRESAPVLDL